MTWKDYMVLPLLFFATSAAIQTRQQFKTALVLVCLSSLLVGRGFALEVGLHDFSHFDESKRDVGPLGCGSNQMAAFEAEMSIFLLALVVGQEKPTRKLFLYALIALNVFCLLYTFSRGGYLGFLIALLAFALLRQRKLLPLLIIFLLAWQFILPQSVVERVNMTEDQNGKLEDSAALRLQLWSEALDLIASSPVMGSGYDTYEYMGHAGLLRDTHNYYVKVMVEMGLVGMCIFLVILATFFRMGWRLYRQGRDALASSLGLGMVLCTVCIMVVNLFGDRWTYVEVNGLVWVLFGLVAFAQHELNSASPFVVTQGGTANSEVHVLRG
jgi:O-antigen ligase